MAIDIRSQIYANQHPDLQAIALDAPVPSRWFEYHCIGRRGALGSFEPVPFEASQPACPPGTVVGRGTLAPGANVIETRVTPEGTRHPICVVEFQAAEGWEFLQVGHIAAKLQTGEFTAVPIDED